MFGPPHLEVRRPSPTTVEFVVTTQPRRSGWTGRALVAAVVAVRILLAASASIVLWVWFESNWGALQQWHQQQQHQQQQPLDQGQKELPWTWSTEYREYSKQYGRAYSNSGRREDLWQALALDALDLLVASSQQAVPAAASVAFAAAAAPPWIVLPLCAGALWASVARVHTSESLLVLRGLGIQTRSTGATYLGELVSGLSVVWWVLATPIALLARFFSISRDDPSASIPLPKGSALFNYSLSNYDGYYGEPTPAATRFIPTEKLQDLLVNEAFRGFEVRYYLVAVVVAGRRAGVAPGGPGGGERRGCRGGGRASRTSFVEGREEDEEDEDSEDYGSYGTRGHELRGGAYHGDGAYHDDEDEDEDEDEDGEDDDYGSDAPGSSSGGSSDEDEAHVVVVFPRLLPGLDIVRTVWREARGCLYEPDNKG